jgi:hypothetical protein
MNLEGSREKHPAAAGALDIFLAGQHLHPTPRPSTTRATRRCRLTLLEPGAKGLLVALAADAELLTFLSPFFDHTPYRQRVAEGRVRRLEQMAALRSRH